MMSLRNLITELNPKPDILRLKRILRNLLKRLLKKLSSLLDPNKHLVIYVLVINTLVIWIKSPLFSLGSITIFWLLFYAIWLLKRHIETPNRCVVSTEDTKIEDLSYVEKDRLYLLLLVCRSFNAVGKLILEKKHPNASHVIVVLQLKNGNLRFSLLDSLLPEEIRPKTVQINNTKVDYKNNYKLIEEAIRNE